MENTFDIHLDEHERLRLTRSDGIVRRNPSFLSLLYNPSKDAAVRSISRDASVVYLEFFRLRRYLHSRRMEKTIRRPPTIPVRRTRNARLSPIDLCRSRRTKSNERVRATSLLLSLGSSALVSSSPAEESQFVTRPALLCQPSCLSRPPLPVDSPDECPRNVHLLCSSARSTMLDLLRATDGGEDCSFRRDLQT